MVLHHDVAGRDQPAILAHLSSGPCIQAATEPNAKATSNHATCINFGRVIIVTPGPSPIAFVEIRHAKNRTIAMPTMAYTPAKGCGHPKGSAARRQGNRPGTASPGWETSTLMPNATLARDPPDEIGFHRACRLLQPTLGQPERRSQTPAATTPAKPRKLPAKIPRAAMNISCTISLPSDRRSCPRTSYTVEHGDVGFAN